jgi:hypothetical protein
MAASVADSNVVYVPNFRRKKPKKGTLAEDSVSDSKRLVRYEYWRHVISLLRKRFPVGILRIMILAGPLPHEEINLLRSFDTQLHITAIDREPDLAQKAREAGADEVICCDIGDMDGNKFALSPELRGKRFHAVWLDTSHLATNSFQKMVHVCQDQLLSLRGVYVVTIPVSKDYDIPKRLILPEWKRQLDRRTRAARYLNSTLIVTSNVEEAIAARVFYVLTGLSLSLTYCVQYQGGYGESFPMMSCVMSEWSIPESNRLPPRFKFHRIDKGDYMRAAVTSKITDCPVERMLEMRREYDQLVEADVAKGMRRKVGAHKANYNRVMEKWLVTLRELAKHDPAKARELAVLNKREVKFDE